MRVARPVAATVLVPVVAAVVAGLIGNAAGLAVPSVARAACVPADPATAMATSPVVFVGTVTSVTNEGRWATVSINETWRGTVPREVEVRGGGEPGTATLTDRVFGPLRYLFFVRPLAGGVYADDACSATTAWREDLAALRPRGAVIIEPLVSVGGVDLGPAMPVVALVVLTVIVVVLYGLVWRARRRPPDWMR